jgi:hypothetical protein
VEKAPVSAAAPLPTPSGPSAESLYLKAVDGLAAGQFAESAATLRDLAVRENVTQPVQNWMAMHAALGFLLAGNIQDANAQLEQVVTRGADSTAPAEQRVAAFLVETAKLAARETPTPASAVAGFDASSAEVFAFLLLGVKNWTLGAFEEAAPLLDVFQSSTLNESLARLKPLQPRIAGMTTDLARYQALAARPAPDIVSLELAIRDTKILRASQKIPGKFTERLDGLDAALGKQLAAAKEAKAMKEAEADDADGKLIAEALRGIGPAYLAFRFTDASKVLAGVRCETEARKAELDGWVKRTEWLAQFKNRLILDINATGYPQPLLRRNGTSIDNLSQATDATAMMKTRYGNVPVPWGDLAIESIAAVAQAFARTVPAEENAERTWRLGVFLYAFGKKAEGLVALRQAAAAQAEYQPYLALFPES